ncbi:MAG: nitroreductase [Pseudomonadota bacterium]
MPVAHTEALHFLQTRRSRPAKTLTTPVPSRAELMPILTAAARTPDHGKLEPWRFIVVEKPAMTRLASAVEEHSAKLGLDAGQIAKARSQFDDGHLAVIVVEVQKPSEKIPAIEQTYSAGAVCLSLLNAALASGWGANWLSGWPSHDRSFVRDALGLADHERVAGIVHIGSERAKPPERPRPNIESITSWLSD